MILLGEDEVEKGGPGLAEDVTVDDVPNLQLNVSSIARMTSKKSLKLWGTINGRKLIVMVDSGESHNFLFPGLI